MSVKELLIYINENQSTTFCSLSDYRKNKKLPTKQRGLYWIWTNISFDELETITQEKIQSNKPNRHIPIGELVKYRKGLNHICDINTNSNFKVVYNGIGGYKSVNKSFGLRERINQELNCNDYQTGTLNFLNRKFSTGEQIDAKNIAISYFNFDDKQHQKQLMAYTNRDKQYLLEKFYNLHAKKLENLWRLQFGTPILCRY